mmetsp:Transcript_13212/g.19958  ORF Transcript_13212/g.19958 Transcript_13212/m.19958 type:complete len:190 (-) Transcript_13212:977-1546(-)|eukprot:CAMPEP_0196139066 /NCGR_PEP_ID=MMETSP0910-20130528/6472_1 /TAXON_ID=49265 /ORGANISM="Thalassiosira rotula, Strain GSO102" /LENGTH=189 /DNA_ID=CAMNT_0041399745 /DNA_START=121 /DNA_END=690 /DNA_ORIENTATION=-
MRSFAFLLSVQSLCTGFSPVKNSPQHHHVLPSPSALRATNNGREVDFQHKLAGIAATLALGWTVGVSSSIAAPTTTTTSSNEWTTGSSSSFMVALSDSDFADFSLPSYKEVSAAEINTNLKGGKNLFGEEATAAASSSSSSGAAASAPAEVKKEPTAADLKAEKAAAKAAQQAARARQQAAVEAAAAAK